MEKSIEIKNLIKRYQGKSKPVLDDLSLDVFKGEVFGFIGRNGAGKSTTIKCVCGILPFDSGKISILGYDVLEKGIEAKKKFGYVADSHYLYEEMTGREYLEFIASVLGIKDYQIGFYKYVKMFEFEDAIDHYISSYSHGMKQKVSIIASLIHEPEVLILDEPFTGLDVGVAYQLRKVILEYKSKGNTVFFTSHNIEAVEKICDRVAIIKDGIVMEIIDLKEYANESLEKHFFEITGVK